jgi:hypothetical protein
MTRREAGHSFPRPAASATLAAAPQGGQPEADDALDKAVRLPRVERHGVIVQPALDNLSQPTPRFAEGIVHPLA